MMSNETTEEATSLQPGRHDENNDTVAIRKATLATILAGVAVAVVLGIGGYLFGKNSGEDLEAARATGTTAGRAVGEKRGDIRGFRAGFAKGKSLGFAVSYNQAYKIAYLDAWEEAGLDAPPKKDVKVSR